jgi:hypothetical protein
MEAVCDALRGMKIKLNNTFLVLSAFMALNFIAATVRAQPNTTGHASDFSSVEYFEPPHQQLMKFRLSGAEAQPQAGGLLVINQFKLEMFNTNCTPGLIVKAPNCIYDTIHGVASSPGHLQLESADGSSHVEGDGFLWLQASHNLYISNNVQSVFVTASKGKTGS